jgi:hypothetical protein
MADMIKHVHATILHDMRGTCNNPVTGSYKGQIRSAVGAIRDGRATVAGELGPSLSAESSHPSSQSAIEPTNDIHLLSPRSHGGRARLGG